MQKAYYHTKESVDEYIKLSQGINGSALIAQLKKYLSPKSSLLEIGSGPGSDFELLLNNFKVTGSDYSLEFVKRLKQKYPNNEFLNLDASSLDTNKTFDGIYSNKVLQHLSDRQIEQSLTRQYDILKSNGLICHSFWKGEGDEIFKGMLVNYQTKKSLQSLFKRHFKILVLEEYMEFDKADSLLLIASKKT